MQKIAVTIPCLNEGPTIGRVIADFKNLLPEADIYVCDNASSDDTAAEALRAGASVLTEPRRGKGNAVRFMFGQIDADIYILCDGDGTYDIRNIPEMLRLINEEGYGMVTGCREPAPHSHAHKNGNRLINLITRILYKERTHDVLSGLRACSRTFAGSFPAESSGFEIEAEMVAYAVRAHIPMAEVPAGYTERTGTSSKLKAVRDGKKIIASLIRHRNDAY